MNIHTLFSIDTSPFNLIKNVLRHKGHPSVKDWLSHFDGFPESPALYDAEVCNILMEIDVSAMEWDYSKAVAYAIGNNYYSYYTAIKNKLGPLFEYSLKSALLMSVCKIPFMYIKEDLRFTTMSLDNANALIVTLNDDEEGNAFYYEVIGNAELTMSNASHMIPFNYKEDARKTAMQKAFMMKYSMDVRQFYIRHIMSRFDVYAHLYLDIIEDYSSPDYAFCANMADTGPCMISFESDCCILHTADKYGVNKTKMDKNLYRNLI